MNALAPNLSGRWTPERKESLVVTPIRSRQITVGQACARYGLSEEEVSAWLDRFAAFGRRGLATTKLQVGRREASRRRPSQPQQQGLPT